MNAISSMCYSTDGKLIYETNMRRVQKMTANMRRRWSPGPIIMYICPTPDHVLILNTVGETPNCILLMLKSCLECVDISLDSMAP